MEEEERGRRREKRDKKKKEGTGGMREQPQRPKSHKRACEQGSGQRKREKFTLLDK